MKRTLLILAACCLMLGACAQKKTESENQNTDTMKKTLVAYFSATGNTRAAAEKLAKEFNADLFEIAPAVPYTSADLDWRDKTSRSTTEMQDKASRPAMKGTCDNIAEYDNIFIGYPMWWYTFPMILYTLFDTYDFSGKTILPFNTHMGSGDGGTYQTIKQLAPKANVLEGLPVEMTQAETGAKESVARWLKRLSIA